HPQTDVTTVVAHVDWNRVRPATAAGDVPRHAHVLSAVPQDDNGARTLQAQIATLDLPQAADLVRQALTELLARLLRIPAERIDQTIALKNLGVDSLLASELTVSIRRNLNCELATVQVVNATGIDHLARDLLLQLVPPPQEPRTI
ncbi:acyl carrier protein, partial [Actinomadura sp. KC216]|uniref:acyl carrier protein n=1 Tax=Actinomadura sp. KC216 TaxID=2530370 RepID=UPI0010443E58